MGGRAGGSNQTGRGVKERQDLLNTRLESGLEIQMIKVLTWHSISDYILFSILYVG